MDRFLILINNYRFFIKQVSFTQDQNYAVVILAVTTKSHKSW